MTDEALAVYKAFHEYCKTYWDLIPERQYQSETLPRWSSLPKPSLIDTESWFYPALVMIRTRAHTYWPSHSLKQNWNTFYGQLVAQALTRGHWPTDF